MNTTPTPAAPDSDPTLENDMRRWLRRMAEIVLADNPVELEKRYAEIDVAIDKLRKSEGKSNDHT